MGVEGTKAGVELRARAFWLSRRPDRLTAEGGRGAGR